MSSMRLEMVMKQKLAHELRMAPHIIQSIEVLTLPALELHNFVQQQLETNPILEAKEQVEEEEHSRESDAGDDTRSSDVEEPIDKIIDSFENLDRDEWREYYAQDRIQKRYDGEKDKKQEAMQNTPEKSMSLQNYLFQQFQLLDLPERLHKIGEYIIYNIDSRGYLRYTTEEIIASLHAEYTIDEVERVLKCVHQLEPAGVGARSIKECLVLQLDTNNPDYLFQKELIERYLQDIYHNRYPKISKETGKSIEEIKQTIAAIQKLNPNPGANYSSENAPLIMPDVVVEFVDGKYVTRLEDGYVPYLRLNPTYVRLLQNSAEKNVNTQTKDFIKKKIESANWVIDAIKQRQNTLYRVSEKIVEHQTRFLEDGLTYLKPLKMQNVADDLQIHVSTVSRAIADKYIQTPRGIFPIKFFFSGGIDKKNGANESRVTVQERVQEIVANEDKTRPLSDEDIAIKLKEIGLEIARRTVTKYRKALGIPSSRLRKQY